MYNISLYFAWDNFWPVSWRSGILPCIGKRLQFKKHCFKHAKSLPPLTWPTVLIFVGCNQKKNVSYTMHCCCMRIILCLYASFCSVNNHPSRGLTLHNSGNRAHPCDWLSAFIAPRTRGLPFTSSRIWRFCSPKEKSVTKNTTSHLSGARCALCIRLIGNACFGSNKTHDNIQILRTIPLQELTLHILSRQQAVKSDVLQIFCIQSKM